MKLGFQEDLKNLFFGSLPNVVGFPGLMAILSKKMLILFF